MTLLTPRLAPGVLLVAALAASGAISPSRSAARHSEPRVIEVVAQRFSFEPSLVEVRVGERVRLVVRSADGVHGLEIRRLGVRQEIPRGGASVTLEIAPREAGRFPIVCSEYCGEGHDDMRGTLVVQAGPDAGGQE